MTLTLIFNNHFKKRKNAESSLWQSWDDMISRLVGLFSTCKEHFSALYLEVKIQAVGYARQHTMRLCEKQPVHQPAWFSFSDSAACACFLLPLFMFNSRNSPGVFQGRVTVPQSEEERAREKERGRVRQGLGWWEFIYHRKLEPKSTHKTSCCFHCHITTPTSCSR